jgi:hypothetical protein
MDFKLCQVILYGMIWTGVNRHFAYTNNNKEEVFTHEKYFKRNQVSGRAGD